MVRLLCRWDPPSSSSAIEYYIIERQTGDQEWSPVGEKIRKSRNECELEISASINGENSATVPSYFRLKAHLPNGQTSTSKATDGIILNGSKDQAVIVPEVEILSATAVQLTWKDSEEDNNGTNGSNGNNGKDKKTEKAATKYDVEKKEQVSQQQQPEKQQSQKQQPEKQQQQASPKQEPAKQQEQQRQGNKEQGQEAKTDKQKSARLEQEDTPKQAEAQWEKVTEVPISQKSVQIDSLTDAAKCEFRLVPSASIVDDETGLFHSHACATVIELDSLLPLFRGRR